MQYTPSSTQSLQARQFQQQIPQMQGGLSPELLKLVTEAIAAEKVSKATQAARAQVAQMAGGPQPTVAELTSEALKKAGEESAKADLDSRTSSARNDMQTKVAQMGQGLGALNRGQPPGMPPPQAPVQAAAGGLMRLPSNLPQSYAGGGIIAFDGENGSYVDPLTGDTVDPNAKHKFHPLDATYEAAKRAADAIAEEHKKKPLLDRIMQAQEQEAAAATDAATSRAYSQPQETSANVAAQATPMAPVTTQAAGIAELAVAKAKAEAAAAASRTPRSVAPAPTRQAAQVSPLEAPFNKSVQEEMALNPTTVGELARADYAKRQQEAFGPEQAALRAARQQDYETAKAAQAKRDAAGEVGWADRFGALGRHAGYGQWGQAAGDISKMQLAQADRVAEGAKGLLGLKQAADAMSLADKKEAFGTAETAGNAARTSAAAQKKDATDTVGRILATQGTNAATITAAEIQAAAHVYGAKLAAHTQEVANKRADIAGLTKEIAISEAVLKRNSPDKVQLMDKNDQRTAIAEMGEAQAVINANRARLAELTGAKYTPPMQTLDVPPPGAVRVKKP